MIRCARFRLSCAALRLTAALLPAASAAQTQPASRVPSISDLAWLIGRWTFTDESTPEAGFTYRETGTRDCRWALEERYIRCESEAIDASSASRRYLWYINYNDIDRRFELVGLFPNWSRKLLLTFQVSDDGQRWDLVGQQTSDRGLERTWATMTRDGADAWTWVTRRQLPGDRPDAWTARFEERAQRRR